METRSHSVRMEVLTLGTISAAWVEVKSVMEACFIDGCRGSFKLRKGEKRVFGPASNLKASRE